MALSISELEALSSISIHDPIPADLLTRALASPPFIPSKSIINIRDLGDVPGSALPRGRFYRSGTLDDAGGDPEATAWLAAHVKCIFDLRKAPERASNPSPVVPGVENVWYEQEGIYTPGCLEDFAIGEGEVGWKRQYLATTQRYKPSIRAVLEHVRDRPTEPFLFHCTAGKDRTAVVAGLLQSLAGTATDRVVFDYMLSRIGIEPAREKLKAFLVAGLGEVNPETPGFWNIASLKPSYWAAFLEGLQEEYGGWDGYVTKGLGFSEEDLETIKKNLRE